jgi:tRNA (guanine-N7-)-methyltransferase
MIPIVMKSNHSFSRRIGRPLSQSGRHRVETMLPHLSYPMPFPRSMPQMGIEIGFGYGEHLAAVAALRPEVGWIGCEPFLNGVANLLGQIEAQSLDNIRIWNEDVSELLPQLADGLLHYAYILFPDPWPKLRHHKRRLIQRDFLKMLARACAEHATLTIVTDHDDYATWIDEIARDETGFTLLPPSAENLPIISKYHAKALAAGATIYRFDLVRDKLS